MEEPDKTVTMTISLPQALKQFVEQQVGDGMYSTSSEVVREALRLLRDRSLSVAPGMSG